MHYLLVILQILLFLLHKMGNISANQKPSEFPCQCGALTHPISELERAAWSVYVHLNLGPSIKRRCIGTIVATNLILTSHRCILDVEKYKIRSPTNPYQSGAKLVTDFDKIEMGLGPKRRFKGVVKIHANERFFVDKGEGPPAADIVGLELSREILSAPSQFWPVCVADEEQRKDYSPHDSLVRLVSPMLTVQMGYCEENPTRNKFCEYNVMTSTAHKSLYEIAVLDNGQTLVEYGTPLVYLIQNPGKDMARFYYFGNIVSHFRSQSKTIASFPNFQINMEAVDEIFSRVSTATFCQSFVSGSEFSKIPQYERDTSLDCECGVQNGLEGGRITAVEDALPYEFPWMVKIKNGGWCGGTIINDRMILTAAHCVVDDNGNLLNVNDVVLHAHKIKDEVGQVKIAISGNATFYHPAYLEALGYWYRHFSAAFDIAVIVLNEPLDFSKKDSKGNFLARPICLLESGKRIEVVGKDALISGWGPINNWENALQKSMLTIQPMSKCLDDKVPNTYETLICVGFGNDKAVGKGDSGGPASIKDEKGRFTQVGVASFITSDYAQTIASFYSDVQILMPFVDYFGYQAGAKYCKN